MAKWTDQGEGDLLDVYFTDDQAKRTNLYLGLYMNSSEPAETATLSDITEPSGNGYARIQLPNTEATRSGDLVSYPQKTFTATGAWGNVYGYFICTVATGTSGLLLGVEHFSNGPYNVQNSGDQIKVTPKIRAA